MTTPWPALPTLPLEARSMQGPTNGSNWVIQGMVLCGENPSSKDNDTHLSNLMAHVNVGITIYVCLQQKGELENFRPYINDYAELATKLSVSGPVDARVIHFPIVDGFSAPDDTKLLEFVKELISLIQKGEKLYIHCWAGRGRTGIIVACLLGVLYSIPAMEALQRTNMYYKQREVNFFDSPEYHPQKMQVIRVIQMYEQEKASLEMKVEATLETKPSISITLSTL